MYVEPFVIRQQGILDERSERADADGLRTLGGDALTCLIGVHGLWLFEGDVERPGGVGHWRRLQPTSASRGAIGPGDHERRPVRAARQALENGSRKVGGAEIDSAHPARLDRRTVDRRALPYGPGLRSRPAMKRPTIT